MSEKSDTLIHERIDAKCGGNLAVQWGIITGHVIGPTFRYDVIDFVFVANRRTRAPWKRTQNQ